MNGRKYQTVRDAAWNTLTYCGVDRLPVDLNLVCKRLGIRVLSYQKGADIIQQFKLEEIISRTDGLSLYVGTQPLILFDDGLPPTRIRFTVAHEIGHIVLKHIVPGNARKLLREPQTTAAPEEIDANRFAARLLAPACVLWGLDIHTPEKIAQLCHISSQAAQFRAARMDELYHRNKFLLSPLEQAVYRQFLPFIKESSCHQE